MTKFLNISTDNTLGGNSASDETVSSQKAIKTYVDGLKTDWYGTCSTAASTQAKVVSCTGFVLTTGVSIRVKFTNNQSYNGNPTLNVNGTGALSVKSYGTTNAARYYWRAGEVVAFTYDGTNWIMEDGATATTSYFGVTALTTSATSTSDTRAATPASINSLVQNMIEPYPVYSASSTYAVGDKVRYSFNAWVCNTAITGEGEAWDANHWTKIDDVQTQIDSKQATISDLSTIRSGAAAGATALQPNTAITGATKCKITYDSKGLVTAGADLNSSDITTALGYTPYNSTNPSGYITGITSSMVTTALGYTPYNSSNPNGYTSNVGTVTSVNNVQPVNGNVSISVGDTLPSQTGQSGKFLTTNGTSASWGSALTSNDVTSIYTATGTDPVNGVAVSNAIAPKQDTLVSGTNIKTINGNSLLGSGNITIETSSTPNVDGTTISYNSSDALQTIAVKNRRDDSTLPIWQGTKVQWEQGIATTWYYWQTSVTALWTSGGDLDSSSFWQAVAYGNGKFVAVKQSSNKSYYSTDDGANWLEGGELPESAMWSWLLYADGLFLCVGDRKSAYSTDGGVTWTSGGISSWNFDCIAYGDGRFVALSYTSQGFISFYSTDGGKTWVYGGTLPTTSANWNRIEYGDGRFVACGNDATAYSTDGGVTWTSGVSAWRGAITSIAYGNGRFVVSKSNNSVYYSTDGGATWNSSSITFYNWKAVAYGDGMFVVVSGSTDDAAYSTDGGITWTYNKISKSDSWRKLTYGDNKFIATSGSSASTSIFSIQYDKCYTDTANPTTSSIIYSQPETASALTVSSTTSGAITLSNNNTYYYNQSGNQYTYQSVGVAHPDWLCFINGVGVKIGTTTIATNNT